jgi:hypothetical protein
LTDHTKGRSPVAPPLTDHTKGRSPVPPPLTDHTKGVEREYRWIQRLGGGAATM